MSRRRSTLRDKGAGLGPRIARRLIDQGVRLVLDPHDYYVQRCQETIAFNLNAGMDYPTWELRSALGGTHIRCVVGGEEITMEVTICSPCTATACARAKKWTLEWPETYVLHIWPTEDTQGP